MRSISRDGKPHAICRSLPRASHNGRMHGTLRVTCVFALLLAIVSPGMAVAGPKESSAKVKYPRYRMVVLGTLGGSNGMLDYPAVSLNDRGDVIAQASTVTPDPYPAPLQDGFVWHGILSNATGIVRDLGALAGTNNSVPQGGLSQNGLISGLSENGLLDPLTGFPQVRAVLWDHNLRIVDLGTLGGYASAANAVNSRGQVVGVALNAVPEDPDIAAIFNGLPAGQQARAFLWRGGAMHDLGTLGGDNAQATAINEQGDVSGFSGTNNDNSINDATGLPTIHPFLWKNGRMQDLGSLGGTWAWPGSFNFGGPYGRVMNARGQVAGTSTLPGDTSWHAFLWSNGHMIDLGTLGGSKSEAFAINDRGQVVGRAWLTDTPQVRHGFLWENGTMIDLGTIDPCPRGTAKGVNSRGQIVGGLVCRDSSGDLTVGTAFYVEKGKPMVDLNTLVDPPSDLYMDDAVFINERGEIYASAFTPTGETRAVLLVPLDE
jgi:probable HAF family extracellular repeat protein